MALATVYFGYSAIIEERYLAERFPDSYPECQRSTKRFVPFVFWARLRLPRTTARRDVTVTADPGQHPLRRARSVARMAAMALVLSEAERAYLVSQRLGRLATVDPSGQPQNNPVGFFLSDELGVIDIGGRAMGTTRKFRNVRAHRLVSLVVDDLASVRPWRVRGVEIRGQAEAITDWSPPNPHYSREAIRIHPERVISWGLDES